MVSLDYVQSEYVFIHDATLEALVCGETQIPVTNFRTMWIKLNRADKETGKTGLEKQFQVYIKTIAIGKW